MHVMHLRCSRELRPARAADGGGASRSTSVCNASRDHALLHAETLISRVAYHWKMVGIANSLAGLEMRMHVHSPSLTHTHRHAMRCCVPIYEPRARGLLGRIRSEHTL